MLRLFVAELVYYRDDPQNPHGPFELDTGLVQRLPVNGTLFDVAGATSAGSADSGQEETLLTHVNVEGPSDLTVDEMDLSTWFQAVLALTPGAESLPVGTQLLASSSQTPKAITAFLSVRASRRTENFIAWLRKLRKHLSAVLDAPCETAKAECAKHFESQPSWSKIRSTVAAAMEAHAAQGEGEARPCVSCPKVVDEALQAGVIPDMGSVSTVAQELGLDLVDEGSVLCLCGHALASAALADLGADGAAKVVMASIAPWSAAASISLTLDALLQGLTQHWYLEGICCDDVRARGLWIPRFCLALSAYGGRDPFVYCRERLSVVGAVSRRPLIMGRSNAPAHKN